MHKKPYPRIERLREAIAGFKGAKFTTTELRNIHNTNNMLSSLAELAEAGEIKWCGKTKSKGTNIDIWQEIKIKTESQIEIEQEKIIPAGDDLPGWRTAFPQLFLDPKIPGKKRRQVEL